MESRELLIVDGNNLLFAARERLFSRQAGREKLCAVLGSWSKRNQIPVLVVFDGGPPAKGVEKQYRAAGIEVRFSHARSADAIIEEIVASSDRPTSLRIVTGDRAIQHAARRRRCRCVESLEFVTELSGKAPGPQSPPSPTLTEERPDHLSDGEAEAWMESFGMDAEREASDDTDLMGPVDPI